MSAVFSRVWVQVILVCTTSFLLFSCSSRHREYKFSEFFTSSKFDEDDFAEALRAGMGDNAVDSSWGKKKIHKPSEVLRYTYQQSQYLPLWVSEIGDFSLAEKLLADMETLGPDGLSPERYRLTSLKDQMAQLKKEATPELNKVIAFDTACTMAYIQAAHDLTFGMINPKKADSLWYHTNDTIWAPEATLVAQLNDLGKYPELSQYRSKIPTYGYLLQAKERYITLSKSADLKSAKSAIAAGNAADSIIAFIAGTELGKDTKPADTAAKRSLIATYQHYYGILPTGKADKATIASMARQPEEMVQLIDANLERLRWMPIAFSEDYILVNVPLMELFLRRDGKDVMHMNVVVGKLARQTPSLNADLAHVVFNPPWGVPPTILKNDVIPGLERSGTAYLQRKDLQVFDLKGNRVDPSVVNAANYKKYVFRQPPGDDNALGYVKFNMPNRWNIYLHDTPHREDFDKPGRAKSSGCVRVQQPQEMAMYILNEIEKRNFTQSRVDTIISTEKTKYEKIKHHLPVHIVYLTAFEGEGKDIRFIQDIYGRDAKLIRVMAANNTAAYAKR